MFSVVSASLSIGTVPCYVAQPVQTFSRGDTPGPGPHGDHPKPLQTPTPQQGLFKLFHYVAHTFIRKPVVDFLTAPDRCYCLNQASLTRNKGRAGEFPVGKTNRSQTATSVVIK